MSVNCPYCGHTIKLKTVRMGRFQPKCGHCQQVFLLVISGEAERPQMAALPVAASEGTAASLPQPAASPVNVTAPAPAEASSPGDADFSVVSAALVTPVSAAQEATGADLSSPAAQAEVSEVPPVLGNYQIIRELGHGGMGAVYLARQISLDRPVALKVMNAEWAGNPSFLVRFTREAYAAAQLVHHNVVQVYDIGADQGVHYFSMEYIQGQSLGEVLRKEKRLAPEVAAGYVLQAARGLEFAHQRGMIHRDIKPDNLMLNDQGVIKVADLGLVRTPGLVEDQASIEAPSSPTPATPGSGRRSLSSLSNVTLAGQAMGTPAYMSPEQARDATRADHRSDVYSLGCTLYVLVTGRPVFKADTPLEVMTKHAFEAVVRPEAFIKGFPRALSDIIVKMLAKKPEERYASMDEVTKALEDYLGLQGSKRLAESEQHLRTLEQSVKAFNSAGLAPLRSTILLAFFGGCAALFALLVLLGFWRTAGGVLGLGFLTAAAYFVVHGIAQRGHLFLKVRDLMLSSSWIELARAAGGLLLLLAVLWLFGLLWPWLAAALLAVGLAVAFHYAVDRRIAAQRAPAIEKVERDLKGLRLRGLSEEALQEFVCQYAGNHWEEFFEALFGYEAKLAARSAWGMGPRGHRPRFAGWRDPVVRWIDRYQRARQEARERRHLQAVEQAHLQAQGVEAAQARAQAERAALAMVQVAAEMRQQAPPAPPPPAAPKPSEATVPPDEAVTLPERTRVAAPTPRRVNVQDLYDVAAQPARTPSRARRGLGEVFESLLGNWVRFLLGAVLLVFALIWLNARGLLPGSENVVDAWRWRDLWEKGQTVPPLPLPLPEVVLKALCSVNAAIAGLVLIASVFWRSWKIGLLTLAGAAFMVIGPVSELVPEVGPLSPVVVSLAAGGVLAVLGFLFGRDT
jgi:serine/threonine protein kinase